MRRETIEGEGACLSLSADRTHLPLRGKLGWMTPRADVKTTRAIETCPPGPPIPSGGPIFLPILFSPCGNHRQFNKAGLTRRVIDTLHGLTVIPWLPADFDRRAQFVGNECQYVGAAGSFALIVHQPLRPGQAVAVANGLTGARAERHRFRRVGVVFFVRRRRTRPTLAGT